VVVDAEGSGNLVGGNSTTKAGLRTPPKLRLRVNKEVMAKLDRSYVFHFFDLPPELRNHVYRELLIFTTRPFRIALLSRLTCDLPASLRRRKGHLLQRQ